MTGRSTAEGRELQRLSDFPTVRLSNFPTFQLSNCPSVQLSNFPTFQLSKLPLQAARHQREALGAQDVSRHGEESLVLALNVSAEQADDLAGGFANRVGRVMGAQRLTKAFLEGAERGVLLYEDRGGCVLT